MRISSRFFNFIGASVEEELAEKSVPEEVHVEEDSASEEEEDPEAEEPSEDEDSVSDATGLEEDNDATEPNENNELSKGTSRLLTSLILWRLISKKMCRNFTRYKVCTFTNNFQCYLLRLIMVIMVQSNTNILSFFIYYETLRLSLLQIRFICKLFSISICISLFQFVFLYFNLYFFI